MANIKIGFEFGGNSYYHEFDKMNDVVFILQGLTLQTNSTSGRILTLNRSMTFKTTGEVPAEAWAYLIDVMLSNTKTPFCLWRNDVHETLEYIIYVDSEGQEFERFTSLEKTTAAVVALNIYTWLLPPIFRGYSTMAKGKKMMQEGYAVQDARYPDVYMYNPIGPAGALNFVLENGYNMLYLFRGNAFPDLGRNSGKVQVEFQQRIISELMHVIEAGYNTNSSWQAYTDFAKYTVKLLEVDENDVPIFLDHYGVSVFVLYNDLDLLKSIHSMRGELLVIKDMISTDVDEVESTALSTVVCGGDGALIEFSKLHPQVENLAPHPKVPLLGWGDENVYSIDNMYVSLSEGFIEEMRKNKNTTTHKLE